MHIYCLSVVTICGLQLLLLIYLVRKVVIEIMNFSLIKLLLQLEEGEDFLDVLNPCTKKETIAVGDSNMRNIKRGDILQLERKGYFRCDVPYVRPSKPIVLFAIPDGRQQSSLK